MHASVKLRFRTHEIRTAAEAPLRSMIFASVLIFSSFHAIESKYRHSHVELKTPKVILQYVPFSATLLLSHLRNASHELSSVTCVIKDSGDRVVYNESLKISEVNEDFQSYMTIDIEDLRLSHSGSQYLDTSIYELYPESAMSSATKSPVGGGAHTASKPTDPGLEKHTLPSNTPILHPPADKESGKSDGIPGPLHTDFLLDSQNNPRIISARSKVLVLPGWVSLLPTVVVFLMYMASSEIIIALILGTWCGATIIETGNIVSGFLRTFDYYFLSTFQTRNRSGILFFTAILTGLIGIMTKSGSAYGLAVAAQSHITSPLRMQLTTFVLCLLLFFNDHLCILAIGSILRQVINPTGLSREKFAAIIHVLGVCFPSMAPISSWIGSEVSFIAAEISHLRLAWDPFVTCLSCLPYRFFPILFIGLIFITIICEKDFSCMVQYEKDAAASPLQTYDLSPSHNHAEPNASPVPDLAPLEPDTSRPTRWQNAVLPLVFIIIVTFVAVLFEGFRQPESGGRLSIENILATVTSCDITLILIRASAGGLLLAVLMIRLQGIVTSSEIALAWVEGVKEAAHPLLILLLAWAFRSVVQDIGTASYLVYLIGDGIQSAYLPSLAAIMAYIVSFITGSAMVTMAVLFPVISPLSYKTSGGDADNLLQCFGSILGGCIFGSICSPIADSSIMVCLAAQVPLGNHMRSIFPYAVLVGVISLLGGSIPIALRLCSTFIAFGLSLAFMLLIVFFCGTQVNHRSEYDSASSIESDSISTLGTSPIEQRMEDHRDSYAERRNSSSTVAGLTGKKGQRRSSPQKWMRPTSNTVSTKASNDHEKSPLLSVTPTSYASV